MRAISCADHNFADDEDWSEVSDEAAREWLLADSEFCYRINNLSMMPEIANRLNLCGPNKLDETMYNTIYFWDGKFWMHRNDLQVVPENQNTLRPVIKSYNGEIFKVRVKRTPAGISVYMRSGWLEDYFSATSIGIGLSGGEKYYMLPRSVLIELSEYRKMDLNLPINGNSLNSFLPMLRAVGLRDGITREHSILASKKMIVDFVSDLRQKVNALYGDTVRRLAVEASLEK